MCSPLGPRILLECRKLSATSCMVSSIRLLSHMGDLQCAAMSHPSKLILIEEIAFRVFLQCYCREAGRQPAIVVPSYVRNDRDSGCHLVDVVVRERDAHGTGTDIARRTARWRACWKCSWRRSWQLIKSAWIQSIKMLKPTMDILFAILQVVRYLYL